MTDTSADSFFTTPPVTVGQALAQAKRLLAPVSDSASLDAQLLLCDALSTERAHLLAHPERPLTDAQARLFAGWVARRAQGEPIAYIRGIAPFYDRDFLVTPAVLIPRPETEHLLEAALTLAGRPAAPLVVDVGTGSGALAITFQAHAPHATVCAIDISPAALEVAQCNAERHNATVRFMQGDLLAPLIERGERAHLVMANLPYISRDEVPRLAVSRYEPVLALDGGADGLSLIRRLLAQCPQACAPGAHILLEIGADQGERALALARSYGVAQLYQDYAGLDRLVILQLGDLDG